MRPSIAAGTTLPSMSGCHAEVVKVRHTVVIGAGIVGLATARELAARDTSARVTVLDKEPAVAAHQSSHNSGVVHAGVYYQPGSLKAQLCVAGRRLLEEFCDEHRIAFERCGKVVVATDPHELLALDEIERRARANMVPDLRRVDRAGLEDIEPHAGGIAALHSPSTAIVDYGAVARAIAGSGLVDVRLGFDVASIRRLRSELVVGARAVGGAGAGEGADTPEPICADRVIICGGLDADRLSESAGYRPAETIVAFRGEYWRLNPDRSHLVRGLIYPVPDPRYPFLGVHFTKRVGGAVDIGPNAVLALAREGYRWSDVDPRYLARTYASPAFLRMAAANWRAGLHELAGSLSKRLFVDRAAQLLPELTVGDVIRGPAGVRAQAIGPNGALIDDFVVERFGEGGNVVSVINAPSPAATSALAIGRYIADRVLSGR